MGLGKTLEMIALMVADTNPLDSSNKTTLIVAPVGVMSNWSGQVWLDRVAAKRDHTTNIVTCRLLIMSNRIRL